MSVSDTTRFLVTGGLPYANGRLHVGHIAGAYLPADIFVRYQRARGKQVRFVCGSDDNGVPITLTARKEGRTPADVVADYRTSQKRSFDGLGILFDIYGGTHSDNDYERHCAFSQHFFTQAMTNGYISKQTSKQLYDTSEQMFLPDRYVQGTCPHCDSPEAKGDQCENCGKMTDPQLLKDPVSVISGTTPELRETTHWFFDLGKFEQPLREWLDSKQDWRPSVLNFAKGLLDAGLPTRSITRDLDWGVPLPLDEEEAAGKVLYVWFDAPIGYVSFTSRLCEQLDGDDQQYAAWWKDENCKIIHFIGEDNTVFHTIIWPAMLMAEGTYQLPHDVVANNFLNIQFPGQDEGKISKSANRAVWIEEYLERFEPDPLRYYLTAIAPENARTTFKVEDFISRNNDELVAALGNFFHRCMTFAHKYFDGKVPTRGELDDLDREQLAMLESLPGTVGEQIEQYRFRNALGEFMAAARASNKYFDAKAPWKQRKEDLAACGTTINVCLQTVRTLATVMQPFLPFAADKTAAMLGIESDQVHQWDKATDTLPEGTPLHEPQVLFTKLDEDVLSNS